MAFVGVLLEKIFRVYSKIRHIRHKISLQLDDFGRWREAHISERTTVFILAVLIGLAAGTGAFVLKTMIRYVSTFLTSGFNFMSGNKLLLLLPLLGIVITGILTRYVMRRDIAHGVAKMKKSLSQGKLYTPPSMMFNPIIASTITLGFGGSAGSEGPIAAAGGAFGANFARWARLSPQWIAILIGCGAGAGIAGIFKAPIGGAMFTIELMSLPFTTVGLIALFICTAVAGMTAYTLSGFRIDMPMIDASAPFDPSLLPFLLALAIACGFYSLYYNFFMKRVGIWLTKLRNPWVRNIIAGLALSAMIYFFPALYGEGYPVIGKLYNGQSGALLSDSPFATAGGGAALLMLVTAGVLLVKCFATSTTNNGGGVAGDFAPTLFAGGVFGFLFATMLNHYWGFQLPVGIFVLCGMSGVMAGAIRAPFTAWLLVIEMVSGYSCFMPVFLVAIISFAIVRLFTADGFYQRHLDRPNGLLHRFLHLF